MKTQRVGTSAWTLRHRCRESLLATPGALARRRSNDLCDDLRPPIALSACKAETWLPSPRCSITRQLAHRALMSPGRTHQHCTISPECMPFPLMRSVNWSCRRTEVPDGLRHGASGGRSCSLVEALAQPFRLRFRSVNGSVEHIPDHLLLTDGTPWLIDVRPSERIEPEDEVKFAAAAEVALVAGWNYAVVSGWRDHVVGLIDTFSAGRRRLTDPLIPTVRAGRTAPVSTTAAYGGDGVGDDGGPVEGEVVRQGDQGVLASHGALGRA